MSRLLGLELPTQGQGAAGLLSSLEQILSSSVNTFAPGFLDKLYAATNAPGIASDLILSHLNTNVHVHQVSPALTEIEKHTTKALASLFGLNGLRSGGISVQGGSASNLTSIVVARNTLYPMTKIHGNHHEGRQLVMFTSAHGHYSIEKAAQACGFGSGAVISVPVDPKTGTMLAPKLDKAISAAKEAGQTPFYINATGGSTVLGSFDPFTDIAAIARKHNCWFHIDASWGGPFIFSSKLKHKLAGAELADSIAINPHKLMGVPLTCSFLLARDLRQFHRANTLPAGYLFHSDVNGDAPNGAGSGAEGKDDEDATEQWTEPMDLADLTLQCGRRGDSLKLYLSWQYYGSSGYARQIENGYDVASYFAREVEAHPDLVLVSEDPPPCLQVCFYYAPRKTPVYGAREGLSPQRLGQLNSSVTAQITKKLIGRGFMIDFAPALEGREQYGSFFRVVVNVQTIPQTVDKLIEQLIELGAQVVADLTGPETLEH